MGVYFFWFSLTPVKCCLIPQGRDTENQKPVWKQKKFHNRSPFLIFPTPCPRLTKLLESNGPARPVCLFGPLCFESPSRWTSSCRGREHFPNSWPRRHGTEFDPSPRNPRSRLPLPAGLCRAPCRSEIIVFS